MISAYQSALSALQSYGVGVDSNANNIANALTDGYKQTQVTYSSIKPTGVKANVTKDNSPGPSVGEETGSGVKYVEQSNVDMAGELTDMSMNSIFYKANLKTIQTSNQMLGSLLDIKA